MFVARRLPTLRSEMCRMMYYEKCSAGSVVFKQGDPGFSLYIVMSGTVQVVVSSMGNDIVVAEIHAGESFGELALASSQPRYIPKLLPAPANSPIIQPLASSALHSFSWLTVACHVLYAARAVPI